MWLTVISNTVFGNGRSNAAVL